MSDTARKLLQSLRLPVVSAPMFIVSGVDLVVAASRSGILGTFPSLNGRSEDDFEKMLMDVTGALYGLPFGVNIIVHHSRIERVKHDVAMCVKYKVPLVITSLGVNGDVVNAVHSYGGVVFHDVTNRRHAQSALRAGVDGLIAVTGGAGGHAGVINPFVLINDLRSFYDGPLLLGGCLNTGQDIFAARVLGVDAAYMGTRFIATQECAAQPGYKQDIVDSSYTDIVYSDKISGVPANWLKRSLDRAGIDLTQLQAVEEDFSKIQNEQGSKAWKDVWSAGQGVAGIHDIPSIAQLVDRMEAEYREARERARNL